MTTTLTDRAARIASAKADAGANPWLLWRPDAPVERQVLTVAELAECLCPDLCDRDHANE
ncbi:MAG: hypothetical protein ACRDGV_09080 [Candidatus Limnocylindria bacterium]